MTITFTDDDYTKLLENERKSKCNVYSESEYLYEIPKQLGQGYYRQIEVYPNLWLSIDDQQFYHDVIIKTPDNNHPLQVGVLIFGLVREENSFISGGGVQRKFEVFFRQFQRTVGIEIEMPPELLATFFPGEDGKMLPQLKFLAKENDWQAAIFRKANAATQSVAQQIINCPYQGINKRMYLQGKVIELMALQLMPFLENCVQDAAKTQLSPRLKKETIAKIHYAREILLLRLENPPLLSELAQRVGISESSLQRGFQILFGTTVFGYLTNQRMEHAQQLLRERNLTVAEVANIVGYAHLGHFAAAFKRRFGITPRECFSGKKRVSL
ncbi:helix-turn-helix transcriptional regulator [Gloeocapsopsis crepidinum LEGE 06123]|uniref:Helix-turn-helix transcriptional regulator n=2 Tax=Gloeocapsopsis crepidinum TaxID=693223 RepID=A0ABR9UZA8_9CHRO|nr:helix-turn-helix transcriptional regulator [Gloeocapsopsis crepidinum LEGE 06123]